MQTKSRTQADNKIEKQMRGSAKENKQITILSVNLITFSFSMRENNKARVARATWGANFCVSEIDCIL